MLSYKGVIEWIPKAEAKEGMAHRIMVHYSKHKIAQAVYHRLHTL